VRGERCLGAKNAGPSPSYREKLTIFHAEAMDHISGNASLIKTGPTSNNFHQDLTAIVSILYIQGGPKMNNPEVVHNRTTRKRSLATSGNRNFKINMFAILLSRDGQ
jgi:hypothetical protein